MNYTIENVPISFIVAGDTIEHNGKLMTVCGKDIKNDPFMGITIFGDSYRMGRSPVKKVNIIRAMPKVL